MALGVAFAVASVAQSLFSTSRSKRKMAKALERERRTQEFIRREQAVRERNKQLRSVNILTAQAEARQFATEGGGLASSALTGVSAGISANLGRNLSAIDLSLAGGEALTTAREGVMGATRPSTFDVFAKQVTPLIASNIEGIDKFFQSAFSSDTGTT